MKRALLCLLLVTACGLPLDGGVQVPKQVTAGQQQRGDIQVLPPGPDEDNTPEQVVRGFFGAQSNPDDRHASARAFLTPARAKTWKDAGPVSVFDTAPAIAAVGDRTDLFSVSGRRVGLINSDGSYTRANERITVTVRVVRTGDGPWQLAEVPDGLLLSTADRDRSFRWRSVYFLAPVPDAGGGSAHLVPDPVFVPITSDPAQALVQRLLAGPSTPLGDSVETAVPDDTTLLRPVTTDAAGVVTVDLSRQVAEAPQEQKEQLSAQLVWTLRGVQSSFSKLRLRSGGEDLDVGGSGGSDGLQDRLSWASYDPDGLTSQAPAYYVSGRRLRSLDGGLTSGPASDDRNRQLVDAAAVSTRGGTLAVLTDEGRRWALRTGPVSGPLTLRATGRSLLSPSWGSGDQGVWFVDGSRVMLARVSGGVLGVPVDGIGEFGPVSGLAVSRDGARIALIAGVGDGRRLVVGRIRVAAGQVRVVGLRAVAPGVVGVTDVSWESATSLVVLGRVGTLPPLPVRVAVDGSTFAPLIRVGLENSEPRSLAAAPGRQLVVAAVRGTGPVLFRDTGRFYALEGAGYAPFYPG
jgi:hypothetical protein